jgi:hypothetical protein
MGAPTRESTEVGAGGRDLSLIYAPFDTDEAWNLAYTVTQERIMITEQIC